MEQRPLRLGDIVDDYCPRERRVTNHAIVAIVKDSIRQTRCTTCDAEHVYKAARLPPRKKTDTAVDQALADLAGGQLVPPRPGESGSGDEPRAASGESKGPAESADGAPGADESAAEAENEPPVEDAWSQRPLIRATLPKTDNDPVIPRPIPEFTMHQRNMRGGREFRRGSGWPDGNGHDRNGFRPQGQGPGPGGPGQGPGQGRPGRRGRRRGRGGKPR